MDIATIIGVSLGFMMIVWSILSGSGTDWRIFWNVPSLVITIGGMLCATMIHFSLPQFLGVFSIMKKTILVKLTPPSQIIQKMVDYAAINRRDGALALEQELSKISNPFFIRGLQLVIDGQEADAIRDKLGLELDNLKTRHSTGKKILEFMGSAAPAFGMIGTLIGLVQMLTNLSSPDQIGAGMATALLTTFYGAFASNLIFIPMAGKLGIYSQAETTMMEMITEGVCAIAAGENPTAVREKMQAFVSQGRREEVKAKI